MVKKKTTNIDIMYFDKCFLLILDKYIYAYTNTYLYVAKVLQLYSVYYTATA